MSDESLPRGWVQTNFGTVVNSFSNGIGGTQNKDGEGLPVSRIETIADQNFNFGRIGFISEYDISKISKYKLNRGDILFSHINSPIHLGKTAIFDDARPLYHGINLLRIIVNRELIYPEILNYYCKLARYQGTFAMRAQHAVNQSSINQTKLADFEIPLAPIAEQKRIADKLDTVLARVDACRERLNRVPLILKRFRQSLLAAATSGKLTEDWRELNDQAFSHWRSVVFADVCDEITVGFVGKMADQYVENGVPFLRSMNIRAFKFDPKGLQFITEEFHSTIRKSILRPGDLAIVRSGAPGVCCVIPEELPEANCSDLVIARPGKDLLAQYACIFMNSSFAVNFVKEKQVGVAQSHFNVGSMKATPLPLPPIEEQAEIVRRVETLFAFVDRLEARLASASAAADKLTPALLAKAFRGELVPQDPNDEPASVLLQRLAQANAGKEKAPRAKRGAQTSKINQGQTPA